MIGTVFTMAKKILKSDSQNAEDLNVFLAFFGKLLASVWFVF